MKSYEFQDLNSGYFRPQPAKPLGRAWASLSQTQAQSAQA